MKYHHSSDRRSLSKLCCCYGRPTAKPFRPSSMRHLIQQLSLQMQASWPSCRMLEMIDPEGDGSLDVFTKRRWGQESPQLKCVSGAVRHCFHSASRTIFESFLLNIAWRKACCFTNESTSVAPSLRSCNQYSDNFIGSTPAIVSVSESHFSCYVP